MSGQVTLDAKTVERVAAEEAAHAGITLPEILGAAKARRFSHPRKRAWVRLIQETGCTKVALAEAWGCWPTGIYRALKEASVS